MAEVGNARSTEVVPNQQEQRKSKGWRCQGGRLPPCPAAVTLLQKDSLFDPGPAVVMAVLGEEKWTGRWRLSEDSKHVLHDKIDRFLAGSKKDLRLSEAPEASSPLLRNDGTGAELEGETEGQLTMEEIEAYTENEENRAYVLTLPNSVHGLLNYRQMEEAFVEIDTDQDDLISREEFTLFLDQLERRHLSFLLRKAHVSFRAFFGRGQPWELDSKYLSCKALREELMLRTPSSASSERQEQPPTFQCGRDEDANGSWNPIPPGWLSDLKYYSANNHPFHGMFCCDWYHPLSWIERVMMEVATCGFGLLTLFIHQEWVEKHHSPLSELEIPLVFNLLVVTIPGQILWWSLFLLWTAPCFIKDAAFLHKGERRSLFRKRCSLEILGYSLVIPLIAWCVYFTFSDEEAVKQLWRGVILGRIKAYLITWFLEIAVYFNPLVAWGQPDPKGGFVFGDLLGLGQWRIEKQKFKAILLDYQEIDIAHSKLRRPGLQLNS